MKNASYVVPSYIASQRIALLQQTAVRGWMTKLIRQSETGRLKKQSAQIDERLQKLIVLHLRIDPDDYSAPRGLHMVSIDFLKSLSESTRILWSSCELPTQKAIVWLSVIAFLFFFGGL